MKSAIQVVIYTTPAGKEPFSDWLDSIDLSIRGKIIARIDRLSHGNAGNYKALKDGLFELKIALGAGYRVYYGQIGKQVVLLISGGDKSSQSSDIKKARAYLKEFKERT